MAQPMKEGTQVVMCVWLWQTLQPHTRARSPAAPRPPARPPVCAQEVLEGVAGLTLLAPLLLPLALLLLLVAPLKLLCELLLWPGGAGRNGAGRWAGWGATNA